MSVDNLVHIFIWCACDIEYKLVWWNIQSSFYYIFIVDSIF